MLARTSELRLKQLKLSLKRIDSRIFLNSNKIQFEFTSTVTAKEFS